MTGGGVAQKEAVPPASSQPGSVPAQDKLRSLCGRRGWRMEQRDGELLGCMPSRELAIFDGDRLLDFRARSVPVGADGEELAVADNRLASVALIRLVFREWGVEYPEGVTL